MRPFVVKKIINSQGAVVAETQPSVRHRVISAETARAVTGMLQSVVSKGGTGTKAAVAGFAVAGKTGTSQKSMRGKRGYACKKTIASFAGFAPADNPRVTVVVIIDEPQKMTYGGEIAAPTFSRITQLILNYLHVTPHHTGEAKQKAWQETKQRHDSTPHSNQA